jgi:TonB-linked SusC/RagA family outer membrane protein
MKRITSMLVCLLIFGFTAIYAQDIQLKGKVTSAEDGSPLPGVSVVIKGTSTGIATDLDGNYTLVVPSGASLVFSSVGYQTQEIAVAGQSVIDVVMQSEVLKVDEVVVTAIGVTRSKKALGYALQEVEGDEITQAKETNVINSLQGRVAGAVVTSSSGAVGASSRIVLRGVNFVGTNNEPLFVVDGVPISNHDYSYNYTERNLGRDTEGVNRGNGASDINPDDIESVSILKGANAAALYGSRASNGVIIITTKSGKGRKGIGISLNNTTTWEKPLKLPDFQNVYGQGSSGQFSFVDGAGGGINDGTDESWGPKMDIGLMIPQFDSPIDESTGERIPTPWVSHPDNVKDFFETGVTTSTNIALTGGTETMNFRVSYTNLNQKGMVPNTDYKRNTISVSGSSDLTKKLNVSASVNYVNAKSDNMPGYGYDAQNIMQQMAGWIGRQVDIEGLKNYTDPVKGFKFSDIGLMADKGIDGYKYNWNYNYHNNPYFTLHENLNGVDRDRIFGNVKVKYKFTDWLSAFVRTGGDIQTNLNTTRVAVGDVDNGYGSYNEDKTTIKEINTDAYLSFNKSLGSVVDLTLNAGGNIMDQKYQNNYASADELAIPGVYNVENSRVALVATNELQHKRINSLYFNGTLAFVNAIYLDFTGRNDWSSTLPKDKNSYFYPSVALSVVLTDLLKVESNMLNLAKIKGSWSKVGSDTDPYQLLPYASFGDGWNGAVKLLNLYVPNTLPNGDLKPQFVNSIEVGGEFVLVNNRIRLDLTYYNTSATDQIIPASPISAATGYLAKAINAGKVTNKGIEIMLGLTPVKTASGFAWNLNFNFAKNNNDVVELAPGIQSLQLGSYWDMKVLAMPGEKYGSLYGYDFLRDPDGNVINRKGLPVQGDLKVLGSYTPNWIAGMYNEFTYKGLNLGILLDMRHGGQLYSMTTTWGRYAGLLEETLIGREGGIVGEGVKEVENGDGTVSYVPNDVVVTAENYNKAAFVNSLAYPSVFNADFIKLREVTLGYTFRRIGNTPLRDVKISLVGRNLAILQSSVPHIDPETAFSDSNVQGLEFGQLPSSRSFGFNISINL